jgi:hypothetical protein
MKKSWQTEREREREKNRKGTREGCERERDKWRTRRRRRTIKTPGRGQASQLLEARKITENNTA